MSRTLAVDVINVDPDIMGGEPVFRGTRVPIVNLFDGLACGETLDDFYRNYPTVKREQVIEVLDLACKRLLELYGTNPAG